MPRSLMGRVHDGIAGLVSEARQRRRARDPTGRRVPKPLRRARAWVSEVQRGRARHMPPTGGAQPQAVYEAPPRCERHGGTRSGLPVCVGDGSLDLHRAHPLRGGTGRHLRPRGHERGPWLSTLWGR